MTRGRPGVLGRSLRGGAAALVAVAVGSTVALAGAVAGAPPAAAATCTPAPPGRTTVVLVVDTGNGAPSVTCVEVASGATGGDVLQSAFGADGVRRDDPVKGPAFVCGIGGVPTTGCAAVGEPYWSYWAGGDDWAYKSIGAYSSRLTGPCVVEGWRFGAGRAAPGVPAPAVGCRAPAPPPATTPPTVPPAPAPAPATPGSTPGAPATVAGTSAAAGGATAAPGPTGALPASGSPDAGAPATSATGTEATPEGAADPAAGGSVDGAASDPGSRVSGDGRSVDADRDPARVVAAAPASARRSGGPGPMALLGAVALTGLLAAAWWRTRRSAAGDPAAG